jgi:hypothetical protein
LIWQKVCCKVDLRLSDGRLAFLNESMGILAVYMPEKIRVPRYLRDDVQNAKKKKSRWHGRSPAHARERAERDAEIVERKEAGDKISLLCRDYALDRRSIHRILAKGSQRDAT